MGRISVNSFSTSEDFLKMPRALWREEAYKSLRLEAKVAYGLLYDRMGLSFRNYLDESKSFEERTRFVDDEGNLFIFWGNDSLQEYLGVKKTTLIKIKKELADCGLIEEVRSGLNKPNRIYVNELVIHRLEPSNDTEVQKMNVRKFKKRTSGSSKNEPPEVQNLNASYTYSSHTDSTQTDLVNYDDEELNGRTREQRADPEVTSKTAADLDVLLTSEAELNDYVGYLSDMVAEDPTTAYHVLSAVADAYWHLSRALDEGNSNMINQQLLYGREKVVSEVTLKLFSKQFEYTRQNLKVESQFVGYFRKGLEDSVNIFLTQNNTKRRV
ncbi:replication initiator protein A [Weissella confusa]|uniref:replication initiator protein A n=1 Tax=Weissella confusa TaxID=1583 RepID=UPI001C6F6506|nr:replication initiator protein A [Weissella confusa]QYU57952.1 replication initiator protein A [Weissella confusa]